ncbi:uncharacterized protein LOC131943284 [Physella acuta]|uniref:uncharacterized protein LOC131943284 n=1 Tax=Physella acuta TaxID=109671 RepID=UPI0027DB1384|nr:uncharacterized protein LOC131943284 [Physella acuta]
MHFLVLEPNFYLNLIEKRSFCFWLFLYFAIENEKSFDTIRARIVNLEAKLTQCPASTINPKLLNYENIKGSLICLRSLKQAKIDTKSNSPSPEEIQKYMLAVMEEYAAMVKFEPFQFYVHQKCLHVIATFLTTESAANIDDSTSKAYTELTTKHIREHKLLDIFQENSSLPIIHNTLQAIRLLTKLYKVVAMNFAEDGLIILLTKQLMEYTRSNISANSATGVTEHVVKIIFEILLNISHYEENKQYFIESRILEMLKKRFSSSKIKQDIIILISSISNQANELPSLSGIHFAFKNYSKYTSHRLPIQIEKN